MNIDLAAGQGAMRHERDGQMVVERWQITNRCFL